MVVGVAVGVTAVVSVLISMKIQKQIPVKVVGERGGGGGSRGGHLPFAHSFTRSALPTLLTRSIALIGLLARLLTRPRAHVKEVYFYIVQCVDFSHSTLYISEMTPYSLRPSQ